MKPGILRWAFICPVIISYLFLQLLRSFLPQQKSVRVSLKISKFYAILFLWTLKGKLKVVGKTQKNLAQMVAGNHLSWLDPILLNSVFPGVFITSTDVKGHSLLGRITRLAGCHFVSRGKAKLKNELLELADAAKGGAPLYFFPEATTGDGKELLPFKGALFELSIVHQVPVQLFTIHYRRCNGSSNFQYMQEQLYYYGETTFFESLKKIMALSSFEVELRFGEILLPQEFKNRKQMKQIAYSRTKEILELS